MSANQSNYSNSGLRDNHTRGSVANFLREKINPGSQLSVVSAYFTIYAYDALKEVLDTIEHLDFLFGEPTFINRLDPDKTEKKAFMIDVNGLELANKLRQKRVAKECADWIMRKVDIKTIRQSNLSHGKMYHVTSSAGSEDAILGSSNFTVRGLGLGKGGNNIELNLIVNDNRDRIDLKAWFRDLWGNEALVKDVKDDVLRYLEKLYCNHAPQFIYYLTLFHLFRADLDGTRDIDDDLRRVALPDTDIWNALFAFQKDGAKAAINKILAYNGCILADSVGLGKTYTALAVIKYFELKNERVLVLCPKKLSRNWKIYKHPDSLNPFDKDRFRFDVLHHTDLSRDSGEVNGIELATLNWGAYDLVVIDESHNFRNNGIARHNDGDGERPSRYQRLMEDIISKGVRTKVLLLSATPVNNSLSDLRNQISFIAGGDVTQNAAADHALADTYMLGIDSIADTTKKAQTQFSLWTKKPSHERNVRGLIASLGGDFFKLLDGLSIARSRSQIKKLYAAEMERLGGFPERPAPESVTPPLALDTVAASFISFDSLNARIDALNLALFAPTDYLRDDLPQSLKDTYATRFNARMLVCLMRINILKRLESSVHSFCETLKRTRNKIDILLPRIEAFRHRCDENPNANISFDDLTPDKFEDPDFDSEELIGGKRRVHLGHIDLNRWENAIRDDRTQIRTLLDNVVSITPVADGKLAALRQRILAKHAKPTTTRDGRSNRKVLVFTAFSDTAKYLYDQLGTAFPDIHTALVTGSGSNQTTLGDADFDAILTNFSPISKRRASQPRFLKTEEIDLLIATDCISEGQNLQDCDLLINYDIHWNPVRIIQRFGRIDRIGSRNSAVHLVNFWPVADIDQYLNVKNRVEARMALVDLSATQTDNLLDPSQLEDLIKEDLLFRNKQLIRLKDEIVDLEDLGETVSLSDFSLDEFRLDLLTYLQANREELEAAPLGLYAVVPSRHDLLTVARPGVLFCLRQSPVADHQSSIASLNPLAPHYLVYIHDDGTVRLTFAQPKETLTLLRDLSAGESSAFEQLCNLFDARTRDGTDMTLYSDRLQKALTSIEHTFQRRTAANLTTSRSFILPIQTEQPAASRPNDFELVTWLVIADDNGKVRE